VGKSKATVKKGTEFATLEFDQANLQRPMQVTPQNPQPQMQPQPQQLPQRPMMVPGGKPALQPGNVPQFPQVPRTNQPIQPRTTVIVPPAGTQGAGVRRRNPV